MGPESIGSIESDDDPYPSSLSSSSMLIIGIGTLALLPEVPGKSLLRFAAGLSVRLR